LVVSFSSVLAGENDSIISFAIAAIKSGSTILPEFLGEQYPLANACNTCVSISISFSFGYGTPNNVAQADPRSVSGLVFR